MRSVFNEGTLLIWFGHNTEFRFITSVDNHCVISSLLQVEVDSIMSSVRPGNSGNIQTSVSQWSVLLFPSLTYK